MTVRVGASRQKYRNACALANTCGVVMYEEREFSRQNLFHMVWAQPVLAIAKEIGISDVALSKACRKAGIPLPGRGYWASVKGGRRVSEPKLPGLKPGQADLVRFRVLQNPPNRVLWDAPQPVAPIAVPEKLQKPHRLVAELQAAAKEAREDKGVLVLNYAKVLRVRTSARCLPRSARLLDALLKQFESRGYSFRIGDRYVETEVVLNEGAIPFPANSRVAQSLAADLAIMARVLSGPRSRLQSCKHQRPLILRLSPGPAFSKRALTLRLNSSKSLVRSRSIFSIS